LTIVPYSFFFVKMAAIRRLVDYPWVLIRLRCEVCKRAGSYRLARLAVKYGAEILLGDLLMRLSSDCPWRDEPRGTCGVRFSDLPPRRSPDARAAGDAHGSHRRCIRMREAAKLQERGLAAAVQ
jgi:hypothetical protein